MPNSSNIDAAVLALLQNDTTLKTLIPGGVFLNNAPTGSTNHVLVSPVHPEDVRVFAGRGLEVVLYHVKAVALSTDNRNMNAAAQRIDELLDPQPPAPLPVLVATGFVCVGLERDPSLSRSRIHEPINGSYDPCWFHRGGYYRVWMSL